MEGIQLRRDADSIRRRPSLLSDFPSSRDAVFPHFSDDRNFVSPDYTRLRYDAGVNHGMNNQDVVYAPRVENVSPTPEEPYWSKTTERDTILDKIKDHDHEILVIEAQLNKLHKKRKDLEASSQIKSPDDQITEPTAELSLFEKIYAENRRKAAEIQSNICRSLGAAHPVPLYCQPSDATQLEEIRNKYLTFRIRLIAHLKRQQRYLNIREKYLTEKYNQQRQTWLKKIERFEKNPKKIAKDAKYREVFEKTFPELKRMREEVERCLRLDSRVPTAAHQEVDLNAEKEQDLNRRRQASVLVPVMLDAKTRNTVQYTNNNGFSIDPLAEHQNVLDFFKISWMPEEKRIFTERFIQHGKNFAAVAMYLPRKTTTDCIQFYYLTKKSEKYKNLLRRQHRRRGGRFYKPLPMPKLEDINRDTNLIAQSSLITPADMNSTSGEIEYHCVRCQLKVDGSNPGRIVSRAFMEQYGFSFNGVARTLKICQKCRLSLIKKKCPVGTCSTARRRVRPSRTLPSKWFTLTEDQRRLLCDELQITDNLTRCCGSCYKRISRRIDEICQSGDENAEPKLNQTGAASEANGWTHEELQKLNEVCPVSTARDWDAIAAKIGTKTAEECRRYADMLLQRPGGGDIDFHPKYRGGHVPGIEEEDDEDNAVTDDEEHCLMQLSDGKLLSGSSELSLKHQIVNGLEKDDTAEANLDHHDAEALAGPRVNASRTISQSQESSRSCDNESCATLSADECIQSESESSWCPAKSHGTATPLASSDVATLVITINDDLPCSSGAAVVVAPTYSPDPASRKPYKPKSAHLQRLEKELSRLDAVAWQHSNDVVSTATEASNSDGGVTDVVVVSSCPSVAVTAAPSSPIALTSLVVTTASVSKRRLSDAATVDKRPTLVDSASRDPSPPPAATTSVLTPMPMSLSIPGYPLPQPLTVTSGGYPLPQPLTVQSPAVAAVVSDAGIRTTTSSIPDRSPSLAKGIAPKSPFLHVPSLTDTYPHCYSCLSPGNVVSAEISPGFQIPSAATNGGGSCGGSGTDPCPFFVPSVSSKQPEYLAALHLQNQMFAEQLDSAACEEFLRSNQIGFNENQAIAYLNQYMALYGQYCMPPSLNIGKVFPSSQTSLPPAAAAAAAAGTAAVNFYPHLRTASDLRTCANPLEAAGGDPQFVSNAALIQQKMYVDRLQRLLLAEQQQQLLVNDLATLQAADLNLNFCNQNPLLSRTNAQRYPPAPAPSPHENLARNLRMDLRTGRSAYINSDHLMLQQQQHPFIHQSAPVAAVAAADPQRFLYPTLAFMDKSVQPTPSSFPNQPPPSSQDLQRLMFASNREAAAMLGRPTVNLVDQQQEGRKPLPPTIRPSEFSPFVRRRSSASLSPDIPQTSLRRNTPLTAIVSPHEAIPQVYKEQMVAGAPPAPPPAPPPSFAHADNVAVPVPVIESCFASVSGASGSGASTVGVNISNRQELSSVRTKAAKKELPAFLTKVPVNSVDEANRPSFESGFFVPGANELLISAPSAASFAALNSAVDSLPSTSTTTTPLLGATSFGRRTPRHSGIFNRTFATCDDIPMTKQHQNGSMSSSFSSAPPSSSSSTFGEKPATSLTVCYSTPTVATPTSVVTVAAESVVTTKPDSHVQLFSVTSASPAPLPAAREPEQTTELLEVQPLCSSLDRSLGVEAATPLRTTDQAGTAVDDTDIGYSNGPAASSTVENKDLRQPTADFREPQAQTSSGGSQSEPQRIAASDFYYELEPVSPAEGQSSSDQMVTDCLQSDQWNDAAASESLDESSISDSPAVPFVAWNLFTLPMNEAGGKSRGGAGPGQPKVTPFYSAGSCNSPAAAAAFLNKPPATGGLPSVSEDNESSMAVAALLQTEERSDTVIHRISSVSPAGNSDSLQLNPAAAGFARLSSQDET